VVKALRTVSSMEQKHHIGDMSFECALCGIAMNEIEGISCFLFDIND
jgi:hypothetical protein